MRNFIIIMATLIFAALVVFWVITGLQIMAIAFFIFAGVTSLISTSKLFQWAENRHKHTWVTLTSGETTTKCLHLLHGSVETVPVTWHLQRCSDPKCRKEQAYITDGKTKTSIEPEHLRTKIGYYA
jgi:hypothetical protein